MRLLTGVCALALSACTSLSAVSDVSTRLKSASATWNDVGSEFAASCKREATLNPALADCALEREASSGLAAANGVLGNYFAALANAANEANFTVKPGLDAAASSVAKIPEINADQVTAVSGLVGLLVNLATNAMRERTLHDLIERGGPAAQTIVRGMDSLVVPRLGRRLDTERLQLSGQFGRLILAQRDRAGPDPSALCTGPSASRFSGTGFLLTLEYCRRLAVLDERAKALADYQASLVVADKALTELQSSKSRLKAKDLAQRLYAIGSDLDDKVSAVRKAFG